MHLNVFFTGNHEVAGIESVSYEQILAEWQPHEAYVYNFLKLLAPVLAFLSFLFTYLFIIKQEHMITQPKSPVSTNGSKT